jgi:3-hydroxyacyl-CoA dehydrogenase
MNDLVQITKDGAIAVITVNNPPVNAMSPGVPEGILHAIQQVAQDSSVRAAVLIGGGRSFVAGADIREFGKISKANAPQLGKGEKPDLINTLLLKIEDSLVPVVMAIHGAAFGAGLELAMAGAYRVALASAQVGQPEVKLGLIPGAAGSQRLPRLVGVPKALEMCVSGNPVGAREAAQLGLLDRILDGTSQEELLAGAKAFALEVADKAVPRTRELSDKLGSPTENATIFSVAREAVAKKQRGQMAPIAAIAAVEAATTMPFNEGCEFERKLFIECLLSHQSKALIHVFFSEREAAKIPDVPKDFPLLAIKSAAVLGAGTMGGAIAMTLVNAGIPVQLKDTDQPALERGLATIRQTYANSVKSGRFTQEIVDQHLAMITPTTSYDHFADVDLVIEAVFEAMALKKEVFAQLDDVCKPGAILASNTSTLNIDEIASSVKRPEAVIGLHFFTPANVTRLLELVRGKATAKEVIATSMQLARKLGKIGVLVGNCVGFVGNRMFFRYTQQAEFALEDGATVEQVDRALTDFGMALGPLATMDMSGLDVGWRIRKEHPPAAGQRHGFLEDKLCEMGRYGRKTGAGYYIYDQNRRPVPDPDVAQWIERWTAEQGIVRRTLSSDVIVERCVFGLVNEGAKILKEGFALRVSDIDTIYVYGYGFPAWRGGPMWYADSLGLDKVYERICELQREYGDMWEPAPLLKELAQAHKGFYDAEKQG